MRLRAVSVDEPELNLTSLIDVVFTLIIFFVVTTSFNQRSALKLELPRAQAGATADQSKSLVVLVDAEGQYFVGQNRVTDEGLESLKEALRQVGGEGEALRDVPVILRADARAPHQAVVTALDALGQVGYARIAIATQSPTSTDTSR